MPNPNRTQGQIGTGSARSSCSPPTLPNANGRPPPRNTHSRRRKRRRRARRAATSRIVDQCEVRPIPLEMGSTDEVIEVDSLERRLLAGSVSDKHSEADDEIILYNASFDEMEDNYIKYQTAQWILYSLLLVMAWGIGLLMLLYLPIRRHILRKDFHSRKLYVTPNAIVYKVTRPVAFPCFGNLKKEKHVLLPSVADIIVEQGYLQSFFGIYSIRIQNAGVRKPASDDVTIQGIANPRDFRKAVLMHLSSTSECFGQQASINEDPLSLGSSHTPGIWMSPSKSLKRDLLTSEELILQKLEEVGSSVKRVQTLVERHTRTSEPLV